MKRRDDSFIALVFFLDDSKRVLKLKNKSRLSSIIMLKLILQSNHPSGSKISLQLIYGSNISAEKLSDR